MVSRAEPAISIHLSTLSTFPFGALCSPLSHIHVSYFICYLFLSSFCPPIFQFSFFFFNLVISTFLVLFIFFPIILLSYNLLSRNFYQLSTLRFVIIRSSFPHHYPKSILLPPYFSFILHPPPTPSSSFSLHPSSTFLPYLSIFLSQLSILL